MNLLILSIFAFLGFLAWSSFAGRFEGDRLERSVRISLGGYYIHLHHWLYSLTIMAGLYYWGLHSLPAYGFLAGSVLQGLTYKDWYLLGYKKDRFEEIYGRFRKVEPIRNGK